MTTRAEDMGVTNRLLAALPGAERERLAPHLEPVELPRGPLYDAGEVVRHAYFIQRGLVSLLAATESD